MSIGKYKTGFGVPAGFRIPVRIIIITLVALYAPGQSSAGTAEKSADLDLMEIEVATVYEASKYEQKLTEAQSAVIIVTADWASAVSDITASLTYCKASGIFM